MTQNASQPAQQDIVTVAAADLPVACPNPKMPLWSSHPKVFLDVTSTGEATCPYCGTKYRLDGPVDHHH